jgi:PPOX class probable F420-dependent enzyme
MPRGPLPPELVEFVKAPRPAVVATVDPDGTPATTATWYDWSEGRLLLSMTASGPRTRNVRANPNIALTVLGDSWYTHVSIGAHVVEVREDDGLADLDRLAQRYWGEPYPKRELVCVTALAEVSRWHSWGDPSAESGGA